MVMTRKSHLAEPEDEVKGDCIAQDDGLRGTASRMNTEKGDFKTSLQRFRHNAGNKNVKGEHEKPGASYMKGRKRPLEDNERDTARSPKSSSPAKRFRPSSKYAPPSTYAHLPKLHDVLESGLICAFIGNNPGIRTATSGHAYAHPSNLFWKLLHSSGCTDERLRPEQDVELPRLYSMGNTNIVERPTRDASELSKAEMAEGTPVLEAKVRQFKPEAVCIVGKGIWEAVWRWRYGKNIRKEEFRYGWQDEKERMGKGRDWEGAKVFVATSTSGLSAGLRPHEKEAIWKPFGEWVKSRREKRKHTGAQTDGTPPGAESDSGD